MRRLGIALAVVAVVALVAVGLTQAGGGKSSTSGNAPSAAAASAALAGSPPPLAAIHAQAGRLLPGGARAFKARLAALRGHPVVVNKWASWCGPCRVEFAYFERLSAAEGRRIAFLGVDSSDNSSSAAAFLRQHPVSYPSYADPDLSVAGVFSGIEAFPTTAFYDANGKLQYIHQGEYLSEAKLRSDIARYAVGSYG
jgi:cytochrome c biogenesis protein CcmG, thiol:disulfide interchange protein DsbE